MLGFSIDVDDQIVEVGGSFRGLVSRHASPLVDAESGVRGIRIELSHYTTGRGDTDRRIVATQSHDVDPTGGLRERFDLAVPGTGPISYDGRLMRVHWQIEFRVDVRLRRDESVDVPVVVVPDRSFGRYDRPHPLPPTSPRAG